MTSVQIPDGPPLDPRGRTPYQILGAPAIRAVVDQFYTVVGNDPALVGYFDGVDMAQLKGHQAALISQLLGGPVVYEDLSALRLAHAGLHVSPEAYWRVAGHLVGVLHRMGVGGDVRLFLLCKLHEAAPLIIAPDMAKAG